MPPVYLVCRVDCRSKASNGSSVKPTGQLRRVGIIGVFFGSGLNDAFETFFVFTGETVGRTLGRGGFEIVHVAGFFLNFNHFGTDVIQEFNGKILSPLVGNVVLVVGEVADHFIDTVDANGREVIAQRTEVAFGEREQACCQSASE